MDQSKRGSRRNDTGGIIGLARFVEEHAEALEYDLITRTRYTIEDVGGALQWSTLRAFIHFLGPDSAVARDAQKSTGWETQLKTNAILADIYDVLSAINANLIQVGSKGRKRVKVTPYPRPGTDKARKIGKGALPIDDLREWIKERQKQHV